MQTASHQPHPRLVIGDTLGWEKLAQLGDTIKLDKYELLINPKGEESGYCYVVLEGYMAAKKFRQGRNSVTFNIRCRGALLFERHVLFSTDQRAVYFEALEPTTLKRITRAQLQEAIASDPEFCFTLVDSLFEKLASSIDQFEDSRTRTATERLLSLLQELASAAGTPQGDSGWTQINLVLNQLTMADMLCVNRVTVAKGLNALKNAGAIRMQGKHILVRCDV